MSTNTATLSTREALERLNILQDPKARLAEIQRERRAYEAAFNDYVLRGIPQNALKKEPESAGGYLVPDEMESRIIDILNERNVLRKLSRVMNMTKDMNIPIVTGHGQAFWVPEGGTLPLSDDQFANVKIGAHKVVDRTALSSELLEDSAFDMDLFITQALATRIADAEESAFLNGDGVNKPAGLLTQADVGAVTESAGIVGIDDVLNLIYSVRSPYREKGVLLMNDITLRNLKKIKNANDRSIWRRDMRRADVDQLFGHLIVVSDAMPNPESGNKAIAFGDFSWFWIGDRGHHHLKRLNELKAVTDQVMFVMTKRVDAKLMTREAIKTLEVA